MKIGEKEREERRAKERERKIESEKLGRGYENRVSLIRGI